LIRGFSEPSLDRHVLTIDPAELSHRPPKLVCGDGLRQVLGARRRTDAKNSHASNLARLLRPGGERRGENANTTDDEDPPVHHKII
jgi:hypothetical protein